jgi:hypothetical protein
MAAHGVLALGIVLVVALLAILLARRRTGGAGDDREDARDVIGEEIDAHIEALAKSYLGAHSDRGLGRPGTDPFGRDIELFIGAVLWRRAERSEPWLRDALREILVLERDAVWGRIRERVEAHLRQQSPAG